MEGEGRWTVQERGTPFLHRLKMNMAAGGS